jgi:c-di-GMP-related signal transduction protein
LGFDYFQGYFFCRPELAGSRRLPVNRLSAIRLITKLNNPDNRMKELEENENPPAPASCVKDTSVRPSLC